MLKSPSTSTSATSKAHSIPHTWITRRCKNPAGKNRSCKVCSTPMGFLSTFEECKNCRLTVHGDCKYRVNDNCGLTSKHLQELLTQVFISDRQDNWASSNNNNGSGWDRGATNAVTSPGSAYGATPDEGPEGHRWDRRSWNMFTIRGQGPASWKDVTIQFSDVKLGPKIGKGRFGDVYEVDHFGVAAIKFLDMSHVEEENRLEAFKQDTACFQNARHDNLVFFSGYTMDRDRLGIVMEFIKGPSLHSLIHNDDSDKGLQFNEAVDYAKQICQGMSYLHTKSILHKDLRSKNVFINPGGGHRSVVITDFGLFNIKRLVHPARHNTFIVPHNWLCYLAPELIRSLDAEFSPLPFSERSDVFAFGTIWFELLTNSFPFPALPPDSILWQVGSGLKGPLDDVCCCRETKQLLMRCWAFNPMNRESFADVLQILDTMPRRQFRRSPSFPAAKSFESIF